MNRKIGTILPLLSALLIPAVSSHAADAVDTVKSVPGIEVQTSVDKAEAYIGDLITYTISVTRDSSYGLVPPPLGANLGAFDVKDYEPDIESTLPDGRIKSETIFKLTTFTTGEYQIPTVPLIFILPDSSRQVLLAEPVPINILSMLTDTTDSLDIRPLKAQYEFPEQLDWRWYAGGALVLLIVAGVIVWILIRRRRGKAEVEDLHEPWEIAFEKLAMLKQQNLTDAEAYKLYYFELTEIVREFLGRVYKVDVLEMTTEEYLVAFKEQPLVEDWYDKTAEFFRHADLVKFARYLPTNEQVEADFDLSHELVTDTRREIERQRQLEAEQAKSHKPDEVTA